MHIVAFLNLVRWKNLLLIVYTQFIIKYVYFNAFNINQLLSNFQFIVFLVALISITAAGYVINDIYDLETDKINKPSKIVVNQFISLKTSKFIYLFLNGLGIISSIYVCYVLGKFWFSTIFIGTALLLFLYSKYLKATPLIGNFMVAALIAFSILLLPILEINSAYKDYQYYFAFSVIYIVSFFAFCLNFVRELVKDIEDINGDYSLNMSTLPILLGRNRMKKVAAILSTFPAALLLLVLFYLVPENRIVALYLLLFIFIPLCVIIQKLLTTKSKKGFHKISTYLKICMFFGVNTLLIIALYYN